MDQARAAKTKLLGIVKRIEGVRGVGITRVDDGYAVKLNLAGRPEREVPRELDGVPVIVELVGRIVKQ